MNNLNLTIPDLSEEDLLREMDHEQAMLDDGITRFEQRALKDRNRGQLSASRSEERRVGKEGRSRWSP